MTDERLAEIRRGVAEVADYVGDGLMPDRRELRDRADLLAEVERLRAELADLQGQTAMTEQHFANYVAEAIVAQDQLRECAEAAEADGERLERVLRRAFEELESGKPHEAEQTLREALFIPTPADEPTPEAARLRVALREAGERMSICTCSEFGPCPACAPDAAALEAALAEEAGDLNG